MKKSRGGRFRHQHCLLFYPVSIPRFIIFDLFVITLDVPHFSRLTAVAYGDHPQRTLIFSPRTSTHPHAK